MWTPKRIGLLVAGFVLFLAGYAAYARFLGGIDGLPALPDQYAEPAEFDTTQPPPKRNDSELDDKLRRAFGEDCDELNYPIKLEVRAKGMVLATKQFTIEQGGPHDGEVCLQPVGLAIYGKPSPDGQLPEINTVRANTAWLKFDQPISNPADIGKHKIASGILKGNIEIVNNRRTPQRDDDLVLRTQGPVLYEEAKHHAGTKASIELLDLQSKPEPTRITATGMDLDLSVEKPADKVAQAEPAGGKHHEGARKPKNDTVSGVEHIVLRQDVEMHLFVDSDSGFLSTGQDKGKGAKHEKPKAPAPGDPQKKSHVVIKTQGPFHYDVPAAHAQFDVSDHPGPFPNRVIVHRFVEVDKIDELDCERLEIQFRHKDEAAVHPVNEDRSLSLEIQHAHATGKEVLLKSDAEVLEAYGDDFYYDADTRQSILKGQPEMYALKEGNEIHAQALYLVEQKGAQQATAIGPGRIDLLDKPTGKRTQHARWTDRLLSAKDGVFDQLTLIGDALFQDDEHDQTLRGDTLKVWLESAEPADAPKKGDARSAPAEGGDDHHGKRPHHVEAIGHVSAHSPDMNVHDTERLLIWFKDVPSEEMKTAGGPEKGGGTAQAPAPAAATAAVPATSAAAPAGADASKPASAPPPSTAPAPVAAAPANGKAQPEPAKPARPIDLSAYLVEAHVHRCGNKNDLHRLWTEGKGPDVKVRVHQDPSGPDDRGVDIEGDTLQLTRKPDGNVLVVSGDLARLLMDKIFIVGPVVNIDQPNNKAWVDGVGAMKMDSDKDFQGHALKEPTPLTVHWSKSMYFDGREAEFHGGVQAEQQNSRLLCKSMQATLDKYVSLKEGNKGGQSAKVRTLVADQSVIVEDTELDPKGKLVKYQRLECPELSVDNEEGEVHASGPGLLRILQRGSEEPGVGQPSATPTPQPARPGAEDELKLTRVNYAGRMYANDKTHTAIFTDNVHVVNVPSDDINLEPNIDKLPENGLYLHTDRLEVYSRQEPNAKPSQQMKATGHCFFKAHDTQSQDNSGRAEIITYDESKDQVILYGGQGGLAYVYQEKAKGTAPKELKAEKIIYLRKTGEYQGINTRGVQSGQ